MRLAAPVELAAVGCNEAVLELVARASSDEVRHAEICRRGDAMEAFGYVRDGACAPIFRRALRDVVVPGFELLGVDLAPSREVLEALLPA